MKKKKRLTMNREVAFRKEDLKRKAVSSNMWKGRGEKVRFPIGLTDCRNIFSFIYTIPGVKILYNVGSLSK